MGQEHPEPRSLLEGIWDSQVAYNRKVRAENPTVGGAEGEVPYWAKQYLLGLLSESDEVLREIGWKRWHRAEHPVRKPGYRKRNLALELADLTKYVLSLWEVHGFTLDEVLAAVWVKNQTLDARYQMDFTHIPEGRPIVICDLDGTIADWRGTFVNWLRHRGIQVTDDQGETLQFDYDNSMPFNRYSELKARFESEGWYGNLDPYPDGINFLKRLAEETRYALVVFTARPAGDYKHIWLDSYQWLATHDLRPDKLYIGQDDRILYAFAQRKLGHPVLMLDDNPSIAQRATGLQLPLLLRNQPYNQNLPSLPQACRFSRFGEPAIRVALQLLKEQANGRTTSRG